ncbi:MAG: hypothetical protein AAB429_01210 [Patescibacteria group bacterium]
MITRTAYIVSAVSYVIFLALDWLRPGFVSNFFSPHIFLLAAIISGILWARRPHTPNTITNFHTPIHNFQSLFPIFLLGLLLAIFAWTEGRPFGDLRVLVTLVAFVVPFLVVSSLKHD